uniref:Secreted protein n=1 Tax=Buteo japonicus TaxID=224669 RepID=A0A8C0BPD8_9AVES
MSSMAWFCSSFFSISTSSFTPSTTICTCSTSEKPKRSALEMSKTAPTAAVSTPPGGDGGISTPWHPTAPMPTRTLCPPCPCAHLCPKFHPP